MRRLVVLNVVSILLFALAITACQREERSNIPQFGTTTAAVIGGKQDLRYPSIGALTRNRRSFCTGTVIASRLVVTAAHCMSSPASAIQFRVDKPNGNSFTSTYYDVDQKIIHPQYGQGRNDIGVLVLKTAVKNVSPMAINDKAMDNSWIGRQILFLGYGVIQTRPRRLAAPSKQGVELTLRRVQNDRFTVQDRAKSICSGDSGGPAMYVVNGRITLFGVNSYVNGSSSGGQPFCDGSGTAFRVDTYLTWLKPYLTQYGSACKSDADCSPCDTCDAQSGTCKAKVIAKSKNFCAPCQNSASCGSDGKSVCATQTTGLRCLQACDANFCCPTGSTCQVVSGQRQCVPDNNQCPDASCKADGDCGPGEGCDTTTGKCQPKPVAPGAKLCKKCSSDADCNGGICTDYPDGKYCTQPCVAGLFCPNGYSCKTIGQTSQCVSDSGNCACTQDSDCHTGDVCLSSLCQKQGGGKYGDICGDGRNCAPKFSCVQTNSGRSCIQTCQTEFPPGEPGSSCRSGGQCASGHRCFPVRNAGYICLKECNDDSSCSAANGGKCTGVSSVRLCICNTDADCKTGFVCNKDALQSSTSLGGRGQCAKKATPTKCETGFSCTVTGGASYCLPIPNQQPGDECDNGGKRCASGSFCAQTDRGNFICIKNCSSDQDCQPLGGKCQSNGNVRFCNCNGGIKCSQGAVCERISSNNSICKSASGEPPPPPECQRDSDCANGKVCQQNKCVDAPKPGCTNNADCPAEQECQAGTCVPKPKTGCSNDGDCLENQSCKENKCVPKATSGCTSNDDCPPRNACQGGKCIPVDCTKDADCKPNYRCDTTRFQCISTLPPKPPKPPKTTTEPPPIKDAGNSVDNGPKPPTGACGCYAQPDASSLPGSSLLWLLLLLPLVGRRKRR